MRYYIADLHFFHEKLNTHMDRRGFPSAEAMNAYMIQQWNSRVRKKDEVYILGDLSYGTVEQTNEVLAQLQGKLYLLEGNHDKLVYKTGFDRERFEWIRPYAELHDNHRKIVLCHYPILCYNGQYRLDHQQSPRSFMLHGHVHNTADMDRLQQSEALFKKEIPCELYNCFCMYSDYVPWSLEEWQCYFRGKFTN